MASESDKRLFDRLNENNYLQWSGNFAAYAKRKNYYRLLVGTEGVPEPPFSTDDYDRRLEQLSGDLYLSIEDSQKVHITGLLDDPKAMWNTLEAIHIQKRPATRFNAYSTLLSIRKEESETLPTLITRVDKALQDVKGLAGKDFSIEDLYKDLASMALIRALPSDYSAFVSTVVLLPDLL